MSKLFDLFSEKDTNKDRLNAKDWIDFSNDQYATLKYINLGIKQMKKPEFTISQNIAYAILTVNNYMYTYAYGESDKAIFNEFYANTGEGATVRWQSKTDVTAYTQPIYPSDVPTELNPVETSLQVIYRIDITNSTNTDLEDFYKENKMFVNNLINKYDTKRYELTNKALPTDNAYSWINTGTTGETKYVGHDFDGGIEANGKKSTYITFNVKKDAIKLLLQHPEGIVEEFPTTATATTIHEYTRYDYSWKKSKDAEDKNKSRQTWMYYVIDQGGKTHYSVPETRSESSPYLAIQVYDKDRAISGFVFKDSNESKNNEVIGDGVYKENDQVINNVKIELIDASTDSQAKLYKIKEQNGQYVGISEDAKASTTANGKYEFKGIIPGQYYLRYQYGDGEQEFYDLEGNKINVYSNGFKSTVIRQETIAESFDKYDKNSLNAKWYLNIDQANYNMAVDENITEESFAEEITVDFRTQNTKEEVKSLKSAKTPIISIPIEFKEGIEGKVSEHNSEFERMCFGIIEKPRVKLDVKKEITNIRLVSQDGRVITEGNPTQNIPYIANLDSIWSKTGSGNVKVEMENKSLYGSILELEYSITVENNSDKAYIDSNYYKFGKVPDSSKEAKVKLKTVLEYLDPLLIMEEKNSLPIGSGEIANLEKSENISYKLAKETLAKNISDGDEYLKQTLNNKYSSIYELGNDSIDIPEIKQLSTNIDHSKNNNVIDREDSRATITIKAKRILANSNDDLDYTSYVQVSNIIINNNTYSDPTAAPLVKVKNEGYWKQTIANDEIPYDSAKIIVTPSTGIDRSLENTITIIGILSLLGISIILIRKIQKNRR